MMQYPDMWSAVNIAAAVQSGTVSAVEIARLSLDRIAEHNQTFNAFALVLPEQSIKQAQDIDRRRRAGEPLGLLAGVPVAIKDFTPTAGIRTTFGSRAFEDFVPLQDAVIVRRLREADAIPVGKTTTPEFASSWFTRSDLFGDTRNPWDPSRTSGGSSGGAAVAVATQCVPLAEGCDMLGSVRGPASFCGVVGLKPSLGRIPFDALRSKFDDISHFGPLARTVDDAALFLRSTAGSHPVDLFSYLPPLRLDSEISGQPETLRIAFSMDLGYCAVHPEIRSALEATAFALSAAGASVEAIDLGMDADDAELVSNASMVWMAAHYGDLRDRKPEQLSQLTLRMIDIGRTFNAAHIKRVDFVRAKLWQKLAVIFANYDVLLCPTMAQPAPALSGDDFDFGGRNEQGRLAALDLTSIFNLVGACPAISVPCGMTADGLPVGAQFVAPPHNEGLVLSAARAVERVRPQPSWGQ
ncbi:MAG: amidase [Mesorhizobium sp.]|uniref:amidase n=1 Tax=unclassified Mesorhizobium TaxID=325217 RepID=UPI000F75411C|nr:MULTISPECIES: amidase [unclassified Mesorhizobium]RVC70567.1 amidase [Mesorhizobium sp. M00.F.Ca.ET.038.03.1.1]RVC82746.1 amidase [Mesorhizobium sp. M2A.F.Ca.ET.046.02.1.1]AZO34778.1 amidase [Mesorhizobium sp. M2A.F.Ca.ET.046.03.2.1]RWE21680.1 MAG: amidase [Mesorhizobium sp.]RWF06269.1 MAG: amidase [Mesorhizobium sp.]